MSHVTHWCVGLPDSGVDATLTNRVVASRRFSQHQEQVRADAAADDAWGHGSGVARTLLSHAPDAKLLNAQVFDARGVTTPAVVAEALEWLVAEGARIINMSFGLQADRAVLREACARASEAGVILLAAAPARGAAVYPAGYPGVLRITGDARCAPGEISHLACGNGRVQANFGACPRGEGSTSPGAAGASMAVAHITGLLAAGLWEGCTSCAEAEAWLISRARYHGPERRVG